MVLEVDVSRGTPEFEHHVATYGPQKEFGYKDFIRRSRWSSSTLIAWAALFRRAGAQFVVPVAEHHDGFAMYETDRFAVEGHGDGSAAGCAGRPARCHAACVDGGGGVVARAEHWFFRMVARGSTRCAGPEFVDFYGPALREETAPNEQFLEDWLLRDGGDHRSVPAAGAVVRLVDRAAGLRALRAQAGGVYYNRAAQWGLEVVINYKWTAFADGSAVFDVERGSIAGIRPEVWQNDTSVSRSSWCWVKDHDYKSVAIWSASWSTSWRRNGILLLKRGARPRRETIPPAEQEILEGLGAWLSRNGEAILRHASVGRGGGRADGGGVGSFVDHEARRTPRRICGSPRARTSRGTTCMRS